MRRYLISLILIVILAGSGVAAALATNSSPKLGLDLQGGISVVLEPTTPVEGDELQQAVEIIRGRVDAIGVAEPEITRQEGVIIVQLPGLEDQDRVLELVGSTAELRFRPVLEAGPVEAIDEQPEEAETETGEEGTEGEGEGDGSEGTAEPEDASTETTGTTEEGSDAEAGEAGDGGDESAAPVSKLLQGDGDSSDGTTTTESESEDTTTTTADPGDTGEPEDETTERPETCPAHTQEQIEAVDPTVVTDPEDDDPCDVVVLDGVDGNRYILGPMLATGRIIDTARATLTEVGQWVVNLSFAGQEGAAGFNEAAGVCFGGQNPRCPAGALAITLDSEVKSAPSIEQPSYDDGAVIQGEGIDEQEAKDLGLVLRYGALPVELEAEDTDLVSATLGEDSLRAGIVAGLVGLALVALYMLAYYRALGAVVIVGMTVWAGLMYAVISLLGETQGLALTLAGVTGIIISVGVTVDAYVVYFERLKDEVKLGRTLRTSAERAFKQSFRTILAATAATFIGAAVLYQFTVGPVRGFAFFLGLSTLLSVLVTWMFTRPMVVLLARNRFFSEARGVGISSAMATPPPSIPATAGGTR